MISSEFVEPYNRSISERDFYRGPLSKEPAMEAAQYWSNAYGEVLYDFLATKEPVDVNQYTGDYSGFIDSSLNKLVSLATNLDDPRQYERAFSHMTFHVLNGASYRMWGPLIDDGKWFSEYGSNRRDAIRVTQDVLALSGLSTYLVREKSGVGRKHDYSYFSPENSHEKALLEGLGNELDTGLVLLEAIKPYDDLTVVPAPAQFEKQSDHPEYNADFIVASSKGDAIGVQVKSSAFNKSVVERYNKDRIVVIDAVTDLGNYRIMRTKQESTRLQRVGWATLLSAQHVLKMRTYGRTQKHLEYIGLQKIQNMRHQARMMVDGTHSQFGPATKIVHDKVIGKLYQTSDTRTIIDIA